MSAKQSALASDPVISVRNVSKAYGGIQALDDVSVDVLPGTVHGFVGENGAGKSTLMRLISGVDSPDRGSMWLGGRKVHYRSPRDALRDGTAAVSQEICLVPSRTVRENVFLGAEGTSFARYRTRRIRERSADFEKAYGISLPWTMQVASLSVALQQRVELARGLVREPKVLILDEPTATLGPVDTAELFRTIRLLCTRGTTVLYVSHFLGEVLEICDHVTIMRDGRHIRTASSADESERSLISGMIGGAAGDLYPDRVVPPVVQPPAIITQGLTGSKARGISIEVRHGEIVGLAGLVGSGRTSVIDGIAGKYRPRRGSCRVNGADVRLGSPLLMIRAGVAILPESRKEDGLILDRPIVENTLLVNGTLVGRHTTIGRRTERAAVRELLDRLAVKVGDVRDNVSTLSGGNQQKVALSKWMWIRPTVLLADEPTRGVDVAARRAIYDILVDLAAQGTAVLFASSDIDEIVGLAHRVLVMRQGQIVAELAGSSINSEAILSAAFGIMGDTGAIRVDN